MYHCQISYILITRCVKYGAGNKHIHTIIKTDNSDFHMAMVLYKYSRSVFTFLDPLNKLYLLYYISSSEPVYKNDDSCILSQAICLILISILCLFIL